MKKKILNTILFVVIIISVIGCSKNTNVSEEQLNNINDKLSKQSENNSLALINNLVKKI